MQKVYSLVGRSTVKFKPFKEINFITLKFKNLGIHLADSEVFSRQEMTWHSW